MEGDVGDSMGQVMGWDGIGWVGRGDGMGQVMG